ncbi:MAG: 3'(2'),5'-bisphosphate nucleotidase [Deltaproteobacteria bacterium]|nr:3'(2'),5'-bisphosphate nucleotidase [Deltaproteobacteria bacterium]
MDAGSLRWELEVGMRAVREAAAVCRAVQAGITREVVEKKDRSPVTLADWGSQALACRTILEAFPDDPIVAEEDAASLREPGSEALLARLEAIVAGVRPGACASEICDWIDCGASPAPQARFWTLDPIDGTKGFLRREQYAIALALLVDGRAELAVLGCPGLATDPSRPDEVGALFAAVRGCGAFCLPLWRQDAATTPVRASRTAQPAGARFCEPVEAGHSSHDDAARIATLCGIACEPLRMDSQAKYAAVARGHADIYLRLPKAEGYCEKIWDHAAGMLVVEESGGCVTDVAGKPLDLSCGRELTANRGIVATNGLLHDRILGAIRELGIG